MLLAKEEVERKLGAHQLALFSRYLVAGLGSWATDFLVFAALTKGLGVDVLIANVVSRPLGGLASFTLHRNWTFRRAGSGNLQGQFARFWVVFAISLGLTELLLALFCKLLGMPPLPGKLLAEAIALLFNFLALGRWTFR